MILHKKRMGWLKMKKLLLGLMVLLLAFPISACGKSDSNSSNLSSLKKDANSLEGILTIITEDFTDTNEKLNAQLEKAKNAIGDTYNGYVKNEKKILKYYSACDSETEKLYERTKKHSIKYYKLAVSTIGEDDKDKLGDAIDNFYNTVYEDAFSDYYDTIYEDALDGLYDDYYDGIINDAKNTTEYKDWLKTRNNFYKNWLKARSDFNKDWLSARSNLYKDYSNIRKAFIYDDNFDVDAILKENSNNK